MDEDYSTKVRKFEERPPPDQNTGAFQTFTGDLLGDLKTALQSKTVTSALSGSQNAQGGLQSSSASDESMNDNLSTTRTENQTTPSGSQGKISNVGLPGQGEGIFGAPPPPFGLRFDRLGRRVAQLAWIIAIIGLLISLIFLIRDFILSFQEEVTTLRFDRVASLSVPELYICSTAVVLPWFYKSIPRSSPYPGSPLLWLEMIRNGGEGSVVAYPQTHAIDYLQPVRMKPGGELCTNTTLAMDPIQFEKRGFASDSEPYCHTCLKLEKNNPIVLKDPEQLPNENTKKANGNTTNLFTMKIGMNRFVHTCQHIKFGSAPSQRDRFRELIKTHANPLEQLEILNFGGLDPSNNLNNDILFPSSRKGDFYLTDLVDMYCNVYFFSGYFYPSTSLGIKFTFNTTTSRWVRSGDGPYYPQNISPSVIPFNRNDKNLSPNSAQLVTDGRKDVNKLRIYTTEDSQSKTLKQLGTASLIHESMIYLQRSEIQGRAQYSATKIKDVGSFPVSIPTSTQHFDIRFEADRFLVRNVEKQPSVSLTAFLADFFGQVSLFLNLSVYTVIVAPIQIRYRRFKREHGH